MIGRKFMFPVELINKKVVIYGARLTGYMMYRQLQENNQIVCMVDRDAEAMNRGKKISVIIDLPERLKKYEYDYVVLGTSSIETAKEMTKIVLKYGGTEDQILKPSVGFFDGERDYRMVNDPQIAWEQFLNIRFNCRKYMVNYGDLFYWMRMYYSQLQDKEGFVSEIRKYRDKSEDVVDRVLCGNYLRYLNKLKEDDTRKFLKDIGALVDYNYEWAYLLTMHLGMGDKESENKMTYKDVGVDRKRIWEKICEYCSLNITIKKPDSINCDRILLLVFALRGETNSPGYLYRTFANQMVMLGKQVKIMVIYPGDRNSYDFLSVAGPDVIENSEIFDSYNKYMMNDKVSIEYVYEATLGETFSEAIESINDFRPYVIVDSTDETCPISYYLVDDYPVIQWPMRNCSYATFFHKLIGKPNEYNTEITSEMCINGPLIKPSYQIVNKKNYTKAEYLEIEDDSFVIVTVAYDLSKMISDKLINLMGEFLNSTENVYWVLVGDSEVIYNLKNSKVNIDKIRIIQEEKDLLSLYDLCDVYLNPKRPGGGFSVAYAIQKGVIVASLYEEVSDVVDWIGEENTIKGTEDDLVLFIKNLYYDLELRERWKERSKTEILSKQKEPEEWAKALWSEIEKAAEEFFFCNTNKREG